MTDYLSKPFKPMELIETIEAHLAKADELTAAPPEEGSLVASDSAAWLRLAEPAERPTDWTTSVSRAGAENRDAGPAVIDLASLLEHCLGKRALAEKLIAKLHSRLPEDVHKIECALDDDDFESLASLAHRLKGAASYVSAEPIRRAAERLETLAREHDNEGAHVGVAQVKEEADRYLTQAPRGVAGEPEAKAKICGDVPCAF
jgi:HPt (histidine-containing phosphotransfer) domain-containing protein